MFVQIPYPNISVLQKTDSFNVNQTSGFTGVRFRTVSVSKCTVRCYKYTNKYPLPPFLVFGTVIDLDIDKYQFIRKIN